MHSSFNGCSNILVSGSPDRPLTLLYQALKRLVCYSLPEVQGGTGPAAQVWPDQGRAEQDHHLLCSVLQTPTRVG